jgi:hypothetical protein
MDPTASVHHILCKYRRKCDGDPGNEWTSVRGRKHKPYTGVCMTCPNSPRPKKDEIGEDQSQKHDHHLL